MQNTAYGADRRSAPRLTLDASAIIRLNPDAPEYKSRIVNASMSGLLLAAPELRPVGTRIHITVQLDEPGAEITVSGIIVHVTEMQGADPRFLFRMGIFLTEAGPDWAALCQRLAMLAETRL